MGGHARVDRLALLSTFGVPMRELSDVVDEVRAADAAVAAAEARRVRALARAGRLAVEAITRQRASVRESDMVMREVASEIAAASRSSDRTMQRHIDDALTLVEHFPATVSAWEDGALSRLHVRAIVDAGVLLPVAARGEFDARAVEEAVTTSPGRLRARVAALAERLQPTTLTERHRAGRERRMVRVIPGRDGMADLVATLPCVLAYAIHDRLTQQARIVVDARKDAAKASTPAASRGADAAGAASTAIASKGAVSPRSAFGGVARGDAAQSGGAPAGALGGAAGQPGAGSVDAVLTGAAPARAVFADPVLSDPVLSDPAFADPASVEAAFADAAFADPASVDAARGDAVSAGTFPAGAGGGAAASSAGADAACGGSADEPDARTTDQIRADVLADMLLSADPAVDPTRTGDRPGVLGKIRARLQVVVPALTMLAPGRENADPAALVGHGPIDAETARALAEATCVPWERVITHPVSGTVLHADTYARTAGIDRHLRARDRRCRWPGCVIPAVRCEVDHTLDWARGGATDVQNLSFLCQRHHSQKQFTRWEVTQLPGGVLKWASPTGRVYIDSPDPYPAVAHPSGVRFVDDGPIDPRSRAAVPGKVDPAPF